MGWLWTSTSRDSDSDRGSISSSDSATASIEKANKFVTPLNPQGIKPCCACPETKKPRDDCFLRNGPPEPGSRAEQACQELIAQHRQCMANLGFTI
ncbi:uncharacterized protein L969DRAFT_20038 [Mixia osmundae IAM 14324]|uniref:Cytochrome c oxidase copper chaperone n=1 Tax=Mixia osmundae (strain CBS 9802 / IAM 14324 / JCM 22182 / KY 12970) TaxID=764103 RepID=G7E1I4_MIXOS|nr:uncharacterized protein L969DRAFT_20038 [Mixia osmundae IAM 14324]KEI36647.1 hypothetical protein L969DRAFT_20038 [Mixia osmundae IAM 14324]GAA96694.1 hypothetical protein E5Q_03365 [Mixia osmundae IAM 14324]